MKEAIVFSMDTCMPCKAYKKDSVDPLMEEGYDIKVIKADEDPMLARQYMVRSVPTTVILEGGEVSTTFTGAKTKEQLRKLLS